MTKMSANGSNDVSMSPPPNGEAAWAYAVEINMK
jgi:hypothetical protein